MVLSPSPPFSPTLDQGVTTHLATVYNSQPSRFASTAQTGLRSGEESFGESHHSPAAIAHGGGERLSCPQAGPESLGVTRTGAGTELKISVMEQHTSTWLSFLFFNSPRCSKSCPMHIHFKFKVPSRE